MRNVRRFYVPDAIVFLTLVTKKRRVLFDLDHLHRVEMFFDKMRAVREFKPFKLLAYIFLPDHLHLLIQPTGEANFSSILQSVQRSYTFEYKDHYSIDNSLNLWQHRFWDHVIRDEKDLNRHFDYIHCISNHRWSCEMKNKLDIRKESTTVLILSLLIERPMYGYQLAGELAARSGGVFEFKQGTLYPALHRMEKNGLLISHWEVVEEGPPRKYCSIIDQGCGVNPAEPRSVRLCSAWPGSSPARPFRPWWGGDNRRVCS